MADVQRYTSTGAISPHKSAPTGVINRYQVRKAIDRAAVDKQLTLVDAEKRAIAQQMEADLISQKVGQDARLEAWLLQNIGSYLENYVRGIAALSATTRQQVMLNPDAAENLVEAEAHARRLLTEHSAAGAATFDPRHYRR